MFVRSPNGVAPLKWSIQSDLASNSTFNRAISAFIQLSNAHRTAQSGVRLWIQQLCSMKGVPPNGGYTF